MNRKLVQDNDGVVAILVSELSERLSPEALEAMLGIEFAYEDGQYPSDLEKSTPVDGDWSWEDQSVDFTTYRVGEIANFPATYPALVLYSFESGFDRSGAVEMQVLIYVERHELLGDSS